MTSIISVKQSCRVATTENIVLLKVSAIDGIDLRVNDRVLVKNQTTSSENGIYIVEESGKELKLSRSSDYNNVSNIKTNDYVKIIEGTVNANQKFRMISTVSTLDTDPIEFTDKTSKIFNSKLNINSRVNITGDTADEVTLSVKGSSSQTANLVDIKKSDNTIVMSVDKTGIVTITNPFVFPSYTTTAMLNDISTPATGTMVHNSTLKRMCFYDGTDWQIMGDPYQKTVLGHTSGGKYNITKNFAQVDSKFIITFTALTTCYEIIFDAYIYSSAGSTVTYRAYDTVARAALVGSIDGVDVVTLLSGERIFSTMKIFTNALVPGNSYTIEIQAKTNGKGDTITWGNTNPTSRFAVKPLYSNITVV